MATITVDRSINVDDAFAMSGQFLGVKGDPP